MTPQAVYKNAIYIIKLNSLVDEVFNYAPKVVLQSELDYAAKVKSQTRMLEYLSGRMFLRLALALASDCLPQAIVLEKNAKGKPYTHSIKPRLYFNLSHSAGQLAIFVSDRSEVGIDLEVSHKKRKTKYLDMIERYFHANEFGLFRDLNEKQQQDLFYKMWTTKEAIAKQGSIELFSVLRDVDTSQHIASRDRPMELLYRNKIVHLSCLDKNIEGDQALLLERYLTYCSEKPLVHIHINEHSEAIKILLSNFIGI